MAGTFKKFVGGLALESIQTISTDYTANSTSYNTVPYKLLDGTEKTSVYITFGNSTLGKFTGAMVSPYYWLTPVATADLLENYNINDYQITEVGTTTVSRSRTVNNKGASLVYVVTVTAGETDITVNCIKFKKPFQITSGTTSDVLVCAYYLETPLTITAGTSQTINVAFTVGEMSSIS